MTREEAITILSSLRSEYNCFDEGRYRYHALSMAIEFLKQEPCEDCVSRQAVINRIANTRFYIKPSDWIELIDAINEVPSAQQLK